MNIITRFAPSPTGYLHLGNIRVALYSWLFARKSKGKFFLRIEDTDIKRCNKKYIDNILYLLDWLGLYWDNKIYFQSENIDLYNYYIDILLKNNLAYKCYCNCERLIEVRKKCIFNNKKPKYDGYCRNKNLNYKNSKYVIRYKNFIKGNVKFNDLIFGNLNIKNKELDDFVIRRSNGLPTYNFCVVIDDNNMLITHIIRGSEHLNNTPKQINLLKSLNFKIPKYIHLPIILDKFKKKLSKRNNSFNVNNFINNGYLPQTLINYLLKLGINNNNLEINDIKKLINIFNFNYINKSPCIINKKKIILINKYYINNISYNNLIYYIKPFFLKKKININNINNLYEIFFIILNRIYFLYEIVDFYILINRNFKLDLNILNKFNLNLDIITKYFIKKFNNLNLWSIQNIKYIIKNYINNNNLKSKYVYSFLRYILIGYKYGIDLFKLIFILKKEKVLLKLNNFYRI